MHEHLDEHQAIGVQIVIVRYCTNHPTGRVDIFSYRRDRLHTFVANYQMSRIKQFLALFFCLKMSDRIIFLSNIKSANRLCGSELSGHARRLT